MSDTDAVPRHVRSLHRVATVDLVLCLGLVGQFLLGMVVNLFVEIPDAHPGAGARDYFGGVARVIAWAVPHGGGWVAAHLVLGLGLIVAAVAAVVPAARAGSPRHTTLAALGALAVTGAAFNGASFLNYGHDVSSLIMAGLWALALVCYLVSLYLCPSAVREAEDRGA